jgi:hypothetical protein
MLYSLFLLLLLILFWQEVRHILCMASMHFFAWETIYRTIFYYRFINKKGTYYIIKPLILSASVVAGWYFLSTSLFEYYITHGHLL